MIIRIKSNNDSAKDTFEKTALKITGISFYMLTAGLLITLIYNFFTGHKPETAEWGIIISIISIFAMIILMVMKLNAGRKLESDAIIADAHCTKTCLYLSIILLASSILFEIFKIGYIDLIGALGMAYYSFREGREAMEKSEGKECCDCKEVK
jgi:divalent metal cation (Fe/Co/Zn/Cd) transporter